MWIGNVDKDFTLQNERKRKGMENTIILFFSFSLGVMFLMHGSMFIIPNIVFVLSSSYCFFFFLKELLFFV